MKEWIEIVIYEERMDVEAVFKIWQEDNQEWFSKLSPHDIGFLTSLCIQK